MENLKKILKETIDLEKPRSFEKFTVEEVAQFHQAGIILDLPLESDYYQLIPAVARNPHSWN